MKEIKYICQNDGSVLLSVDSLTLSNEDNGATITITYPSELSAYTKRADIKVMKDGTTDFEIGDTSDILTFSLTSAHTKRGEILIQPIAYLDVALQDYVDAERIKWATQKIRVLYSIDAAESTVSVDVTKAADLQSQIDALELRIEALEAL